MHDKLSIQRLIEETANTTLKVIRERKLERMRGLPETDAPTGTSGGNPVSPTPFTSRTPSPIPSS